ncbi:MAG: biotin/lipoate--protein ligase family protein [Acetobacteraceae bacterium]
MQRPEGADPSVFDASSALDLPPPYRLVSLRELGDAHAHACQIAWQAGAGTFVWVRRYDTLEIAVVLEPEEQLAAARRAFFLGMAALADAVAAHCPPEKALTFDWPDTIRLDGARIGGGRLGWPERCREDDVPPWLVFSAMLMAAKPDSEAAGPAPSSTSFEDEGFDPDARERVAESFARHLLWYSDQYESDGFAPIAASFLGRLACPDESARLGIGGNGDLVLDREHPGRRRRPLVPKLRSPGWLDLETGSVRR